MRKVLLAASALAFAAAPAFAADDVMAGYYGNTLISTGGIAEIHTHFRADHSFDLTGSRMGMSRSFKGTWTIDDKANLCRTFVGEMPPSTTNPVCSPMTAHKAGDSWTTTAKDGSTRNLTIKPGVE